jgi:hypothetical protein
MDLFNEKHIDLAWKRITWFCLGNWSEIRRVWRLTRQVPLVEQELLTLPEHLSLWVSCYLIFISLWKIVWSSIILLLPLFMCMFCRSFFFPFVLFLFAIVLSFLLWYTHSDYPFGIFKLFLFHFSYPSKIKLSFFMLNLYVFH